MLDQKTPQLKPSERFRSYGYQTDPGVTSNPPLMPHSAVHAHENTIHPDPERLLREHEARLAKRHEQRKHLQHFDEDAARRVHFHDQPGTGVQDAYTDEGKAVRLSLQLQTAHAIMAHHHGNPKNVDAAAQMSAQLQHIHRQMVPRETPVAAAPEADQTAALSDQLESAHQIMTDGVEDHY